MQGLVVSIYNTMDDAPDSLTAHILNLHLLWYLSYSELGSLSELLYHMKLEKLL